MKKPVAKKLAKLVVKKDKLVNDLLEVCTDLQDEWKKQYMEMERLKIHCLEHPDDKSAKRALKKKTFSTMKANREYSTACAYLRSIRDIDSTRLPDDVQDQLSLMNMPELTPPAE